jgi:nucleoside 2-deoxyribosyltransferase
MKPIVYLAGPVLGTTHSEARAWRQEAAEVFADIGILAISPVRAEAPADGIRYGFGDQVHGGPLAIASKNFFDVGSCDIVFAFMPHQDHVSIGTLLEIGYAKAMGKLVVLVTDDAYLLRHPVIRGCCGWIVEDFQAGLLIVGDLLHAYSGGRNV